MKQIVISGGLTRDAVLRTTQAGEHVASFSVAVSEGFGDNKRSLYFDCSLWGKRGQNLVPHLTKGSRVSVAGDLSTREHEGKTYLTVRANEVTLMGGGEKREHVEMPPKYAGTEPADYDKARGGYGGGGRAPLDDEIPFAPEVRG